MQKAVAAYFTSNQILPFGLEEQRMFLTSLCAESFDKLDDMHPGYD